MVALSFGGGTGVKPPVQVSRSLSFLTFSFSSLSLHRQRRPVHTVHVSSPEFTTVFAVGRMEVHWLCVLVWCVCVCVCFHGHQCLFVLCVYLSQCHLPPFCHHVFLLLLSLPVIVKVPSSCSHWIAWFLVTSQRCIANALNSDGWQEVKSAHRTAVWKSQDAYVLCSLRLLQSLYSWKGKEFNI